MHESSSNPALACSDSPIEGFVAESPPNTDPMLPVIPIPTTGSMPDTLRQDEIREEPSGEITAELSPDECATLEDLSQHTYIAESWIPNSGSGLFVSATILAGQRLGTYCGTVILSTREAIRVEDKSYLMRLGPQCYVDTRETLDCKARYINDCRIPHMYNATFIKDPSRHCAYVMATSTIKANQEIYVDYGKWYWALLKPTKVSARFLQSKIDSLSDY